MTQHALDDEWAGDHSEENAERVLDYLLENFAERWIQGRGTNADAVSEFLVDTIKDHFDVEVPASIGFPLAKLMVTLHDECRNKVLTGVNTVLGADVVKSFYEVSAPLPLAAPAPAEDDKMEEDKKAPIEEGADDAAAPAKEEEDDGWTTVDVKPKKKGNKGKGKKFE